MSAVDSVETGQAATIDRIRQHALPLGTTVMAGGDRLNTTVQWAVLVSPDNLPYLEGGELLLLVPVPAAGSTLTRFVEEAQRSGAAGVIIADEWPSLAIAAAETRGLPVLKLPPGSRMREVEQSVIALILDRANDNERKSAHIYQQLVQIAAESGGLDQLVHAIAQLIDKAVIVQDKRMHPLYSAIPPHLIADWDRLTAWLTHRDELPAQFQDRLRLPMRTTPTLFQPIPNTRFARVITPIVTQNVGRGYVSFIAQADSFSEADSVASRHTAAVCALEMAHAKAISETEKRLRGDFLDGLIRGSLTESEAMIEGAQFGHDMIAPHIALAMRWVEDSTKATPRQLETIVNGFVGRRPGALLARRRDQEIHVFYACDSASPVQATRQLAADIQAEARHEFATMNLAIGIGSVVNRISEWRISYREAIQAVKLAVRLKATAALSIGDLGVYTFLSHPDYHDDLLALRDSVIGNLLRHEEKQRADLLITLEAFFQTHGNHTQTAELLNVHRNTLGYRLGRISEITGLDLNQPDVRLAVHLALKIHRLLSNE